MKDIRYGVPDGRRELHIIGMFIADRIRTERIALMMTVLGDRSLLHPHVNEMPFTRSLSRVTIPEDVEAVRVRWSGDGD